MEPFPLTQIGQLLLRNGYFLAAYALFVDRNHRKIDVILKYFRAVYQNYQVAIGIDELKLYLNLEADLYQDITNFKLD